MASYRKNQIGKTLPGSLNDPNDDRALDFPDSPPCPAGKGMLLEALDKISKTNFSKLAIGK
jgi:hypothetical protein